MHQKIDIKYNSDSRLLKNDLLHVYLSLSGLLWAHANEHLKRYTGKESSKVPFFIGISGGVSVGKSTLSGSLQKMLSREEKRVALICTDSFLYPNAILEDKNLISKKGFPESYNTPALLQCIQNIKNGNPIVKIPIYSHSTYDILPGQETEIRQPDIVILEGVYVLQSRLQQSKKTGTSLMDISIYVDAEEESMEQWYLTRFLQLREEAKTRPDSFFYPYTLLAEEDALARAREVWQTINLPNLHEHIQPFRDEADIIIHKTKEHQIDYILTKFEIPDPLLDDGL
ncbi:MAG: type I pantothenate kinase [Bacteroidales bacterium]|jgi:type I pantothenate kinase|nr:type I pantothenate kinase [Bacteroidales bacterium]